jgi:hypothetical protein
MKTLDETQRVRNKGVNLILKYYMLDFLRGMKRFVGLLFVLSCSFGLGCKSPAHQSDAQDTTARKTKATGQSSEDPSAQGRGTDAATSSVSGYSRTKTRSSDNSDEEGETKANLEGGDPSIFHPPVHKGQARERIVETAPSTPTPTPNRPIDRPLDPSGLPLSSPSPGG